MGPETETPECASHPARLCDLLDQCREDILREWEGLIRSEHAAEHLGSRSLRDHIPDLLQNISEYVRDSKQPRAAPEISLKALIQQHALERLEVGFDLHAVIGELAVLRSVVYRRYRRHAAAWNGAAVVEELERFDEAIASIAGQSVTAYARARERTLVGLDRLSAAALGSGNLDAFLPKLLRVLLETTPSADYLTIFLRDGEELVVRAVAGLGMESTLGFKLRLGEGFAGLVGATRKVHELEDASGSEIVRDPAVRRLGLKALYGVPLIDEGELVGVASMGSRSAFTFSLEDKQLFRAMCARATELIAQARLLDSLRLSEERFRLMVENITEYAIFMIDPDGKISSWNAGVERFGGYRAEEVLGQDFSIFYTEEDRRSGAPELELKEAREKGVAKVQGVRVRKDGSEFWADVTNTALRDAHGELRGFVKIMKDVTTERRLAEERRRSAELAEEFVAIVGHDLRTPLSAILLGATGLQRQEGFTPRQRSALERIVSSAQRATRMVTDLLDFARARAGLGIPVRRQPTDLDRIVAQTVEELREAHPTARLELHGGPAGRGEWDPDRLAQILTNLVVNAIHHGEHGQPVRIELASDDDTVTLSVHNAGAIPAADQQRIFEPYRRGRDPSGRAAGLGLGLYITRQLVEAHGGRIELASSPEAGTSFTVRLPRRGADSPAHPESTSRH